MDIENILSLLVMAAVVLGGSLLPVIARWLKRGAHDETLAAGQMPEVVWPYEEAAEETSQPPMQTGQRVPAERIMPVTQAPSPRLVAEKKRAMPVRHHPPLEDRLFRTSRWTLAARLVIASEIVAGPIGWRRARRRR